MSKEVPLNNLCSIPKCRNGSVLILALWVLFFLGALAVGIGAHVNSAIRLASWYRNRVQSYNVAQAGVEESMIVVASDTNSWDSLEDSWGNTEDMFKKHSVGDGYYSIYYTNTDLSGQIVTNYGLRDEERLVNINDKYGSKILESLLIHLGEDDDSALKIVSAISDWRDDDDDVSVDGAENDYYKSLHPAYRCSNRDFASVKELMLVKGMSEKLYGQLAPYLTVFGNGKINLNTAGEMVLKSLATAVRNDSKKEAESLAKKIIGFRESGNVFTNASSTVIRQQMRDYTDLSSKEDSILSGMLRYTTLKSSCFRGEVFGWSGFSDTPESRIMFVFDKNNKKKLLWYEY